ncbi:VOC family protein [Pseudonocardia humida]|uniref:VOC family protein n=1 Tax=Pseudonocardia humida TaxID=2800819 RepID=A0ABT0ZSX2_9PSEU|nr:VOC family protein [Pseudonocardia humida]MCO1653821.1 VOC family protein [Pseudonocardia humida]
MGIHRLNHAVLYVRDIDRSVAFYRDLLGFRVVMARPGSAAFLQAPDSTNDHDIGLFALGAGLADSSAGTSTVGLYHLGWEIGTLGELVELAAVLDGAGALVGATDHGTTKSLYARDPDGLEFEVAWLVPAELLDDAAIEGRSRRGVRLDLEAEVARYGADTRSGVGVSTPTAPV